MVDRTPLQSTMSNYIYRCIPMQCYHPMSSWPFKEHRTAVPCCTGDQVATLEQLESIWRDRSDGLVLPGLCTNMILRYSVQISNWTDRNQNASSSSYFKIDTVQKQRSQLSGCMPPENRTSTKQTRNLKDILRDFTNIKHRNDIKLVCHLISGYAALRR